MKAVGVLPSTMSDGPRRFRLGIAVLLAFIADAVWGGSVSWHSARPSFGLTTLLVSCIFVGPNSGAALGFALGLLEGSYAEIYVGSFIVSRTIAGWIVGELEHYVFRDSAPMAVVTAGIGTLVAECLLFIFAPHSHVAHWELRTCLEAAADAAIALPIYFLLRRIVRPHSHK